MRVWRPVRSLGGLICLLLVSFVWFLAAEMAGDVFPVRGATFWLVVGALLLFLFGGVLLYWGLAFFTLRYVFDRNGLIIHWGGVRQVIPMGRIVALRRWEQGESVRERGLWSPGYHRGHGRSPALGQVEFYATAGRSAQLLVCTPGATFVVSPQEPAEFIQELEARRSLGITRQLSQERLVWRLFASRLWRDRLLWAGQGVALLINQALFALLCYWYPILQKTRPILPLHYGEILEGNQVRIIPDVVGWAGELFKLPAFALALGVLNLGLIFVLYRRHRLLTLLLTAVSVLTQVMFLLGTAYILYR